MNKSDHRITLGMGLDGGDVWEDERNLFKSPAVFGVVGQNKSLEHPPG